ncbi:MAG TPA: sigma-54 dependent transcriptional regulator [Thermodesulfobacteriota bacterium]|nr:sigma-54 dependent transcriptional regulator [Thermodesulfobacteriota bacterium]
MEKDVNILVVDDEEIVRESLCSWLKEDGYQAEAVEDGFKALDIIKKKPWNVLFVDLKMPGMDGLEVMRRAKALQPDVPIIIITAYATVNTAVEAMKEGAYDYLVKPFNPEEISLIIRRLIEKQALLKENIFLRKELKKQFYFQDLISKSRKMQDIFELARTVGKSTSNILILGESGTGKELLARAIHLESLRADTPFVSVSCAALTETLLESELFGHEKGAFTHAISQKKGKFEMANGGTIFLDEIGDIGAKLQLDLLRILQEKEFSRVGGNEVIKVDVRIIAATNRDLKKAIEEGKFREDLYYRLNVISILIPPLRERKEDIPLLVDHFIEKFNIEMKKKIEGISPEALNSIMAYIWPGNVRELENTIERAMVITKGTMINVEDLGLPSRAEENSLTCAAPPSGDKSMKAVEKNHMAKILKENDWNIQRSAEILGIDRVTLYNKIKKYELKK